MGSVAHSQTWAALQDGLRRQFGEERYGRWIAPLRVLSQDGEELRLGAQDPHVVQWVEKRFAPQIRALLRRRPREGVSRVVLAVEATVAGASSTDAPDEGPAEQGREASEAGQASEAEQGREASEAGQASEAGEGVVRNASGSSGRESKREERGVAGRENGRVDSSRSTDPTAGWDLANFVVGHSNELAHNAILRVLENPGELYNPLFLYGPAGVGKTHLLRGAAKAYRFGRSSRWRRGGGATTAYPTITYLTGEQLFHRYVASVRDRTVLRFRESLRTANVLLVDGVEDLVGKEKTQIELLHTLDALLDGQRQVILASANAPTALTGLDSGLVGRLAQGLVVSLRRPDLKTRLAIARRRARSLRNAVSEEVLRYVADTVGGGVTSLCGALMQLDLHAHVAGHSLSLEEAKAALAEIVYQQRQRVSVESVVAIVARHFGLAPEKLVAPGRGRASVSVARQAAMYLIRRHTSCSLREIGQVFGRRDPTTVRNALKRLEALLERRDPVLRLDLDQIEVELLR